ncbi:MAG: hypothetical protein M1142_04535 [Patescibacteria group bacterium]|nr:hypothetical protein [Patescibacteria group bacterium]
MADLERIKNIVTPVRRVVTAYGLKTLWSIEFREAAAGNLTALNEALAEGNGAIGLTPHFSKGDFLADLVALNLNSKEARRRPTRIPIAAHQRPFYLDILCGLGDVSLATIITGDTRLKENELKTKGKPIPWRNINPTEAMNDYLDTSIEELEQGGLVFLAPQGGRRDSLRPFRGGPLSRLMDRAGEKGVNPDKIPVFSVGLEIEGVTDYSNLKGLNLWRKYTLTLGRTVKRGKIKGDIDQWAYESMLELAPEAYRPKTRINKITQT